MATVHDPSAGHVPDAVIYGPVTSRRFGRSLGISCDDPATVGCRWHCPYCQLGAQPHVPDALRPSADRILATLQHHLAARPACDTLCIAGNGEPTDHPDFAAIAAQVGYLGRRYGLRSVLLTNGDGLARAAPRSAAASLDETWVKVDPGPPQGAWRAGLADRHALLAALGPLRVQALVYAGPGPSAGTASEAAREAWLAQLASLPVVALDLTTISRRPAQRGLRPVRRTLLAQWHAAAERRLGCTVRSFGPGA